MHNNELAHTPNDNQESHPLEQLPDFAEHMAELEAKEQDNIDAPVSHSEAVTHRPGRNLAKDFQEGNLLQKNFQQERAQEIFERALNAEMVDIDELKILAEAGADGLALEKMEYEGAEIPIIHLNGYPIKFLQSVINLGMIRQNPAIWAMPGSTVKQAADDTDVNDVAILQGRGANTLCTTYVDTNYSTNNSTNDLVYMFTKVRPDSVIDAGPGDIYSFANSGKDRPNLLSTEKGGVIKYMPEEIAREGHKFNEVLLRRYDEAGNPLLPTAILTRINELHHNSRDFHKPTDAITEDSLRSAKYFNVPIVLLDTTDYHPQEVAEEPQPTWDDDDGSSYDPNNSNLDEDW